VQINLAKSSGFCFGVKRALNIALELKKSTKTIEMLGDIVHNEEVVKQMRKTGIKKVKDLKKGGNKTLLIRAHGACIEVIRKAKRLHYKIIDATCPMVKEIHKIARDMEKKGYRIIIIGDKKHDEVHGIAGQISGKAIIIDPVEAILPKLVRRINKACVVVQSTQKLEKVLKIVTVLKKRIKDVKFFNTICAPTRIKQQEINSLPLKNKVMIIIGSKKSANTKRLFEISKSLNHKSYWVRSDRELKQAWFRGIKTVGVTSGASTPDSTTQEVIKCIRRLAN
jgi:4-hydroxy-3-methylbut-2-enyl diphosphate reductase